MTAAVVVYLRKSKADKKKSLLDEASPKVVKILNLITFMKH
jgi:hypothetical protein